MEKEYIILRFKEDYKIFKKGTYLKFPKHIFTGQIKLSLDMEELNTLMKADILEEIIK